MKKICVVTGTRAEYGLLKPLMELFKNDPNFELQIICTGMHLSPEFGLTYSSIEEDGFLIEKKIEILLSSDTSVGVNKSMGLAQISFAESFDELSPDLLILLGDRTETFSAAISALIGGIPIAHIHGGELTEGAYDDAIRHSITKMSHLHFTSTEAYRKRVIQMGEQPNMVFNVGAPGLDSIQSIDLLNKEDFEASIGTRLKTKNCLITFHPVTLEHMSARIQFQEILSALDELENTLLIFTKPNSDKGGRVIIKMIDEYVKKNPEKSIQFTSLGQLRYLSALQFMNVVIGNSSSGIIEVPSFNIPTINIGNRQKGRVAANSVIHCEPQKAELSKVIKKAMKMPIIDVTNPYGIGKASNQIYKIIKNQQLKTIEKSFYNL